MFNFLRKRQPEEISRTEPGYEETERRTPKGGIVLLIIMFIAGLFFGWRALSDLGGVPQAPPTLSSCGRSYHNAYLVGSRVRPYSPEELYREYSTDYDYYGYGYGKATDYSKCGFTDIEKKGGIPELFQKKQPLETQRIDLQRSRSANTQAIQIAQSSISRLTTQYGIGLQEAQQRVGDPLFATPDIRAQLSSLFAQEAQLKSQEASFTAKNDSLNAQIKQVDDDIRAAYKPVLKEQNKKLRFYEFQVFLLQFLFVLPFFWFSFRGYRRLLSKNSPYTVIVLSILAVAGVLMLRVVLFWFWDLFLAEIIRTLWQWIQAIQILRSIIFYLGMALSFAIFGGAVYFLQKKIFDPRRVMLRRFRAKQCPHCQTNLDLSLYYCPNCGHQIKEKCEKCGQARFVGLPACPSCGARK